MSRSIPIIPSVVVAAAVAVMIGLGVWQLQRANVKEAMLDRYVVAESRPTPVTWPTTQSDREQALFRRSSLECLRVISMRQTAGRSIDGEAGQSHIARCALSGGGEAEVALGWSRSLETPKWAGGAVSGFVAPAGDDVRLVASPAEAGLVALAPPDPRDLPNNHLSYAMQWFFFAASAVVVYVLALRRKRS